MNKDVGIICNYFNNLRCRIQRLIHMLENEVDSQYAESYQDSNEKSCCVKENKLPLCLKKFIIKDDDFE